MINIATAGSPDIETGLDYAIDVGDGVERVTVLDANYADAPGCVLARRESSGTTAVAISCLLGPWRGTKRDPAVTDTQIRDLHKSLTRAQRTERHRALVLLDAEREAAEPVPDWWPGTAAHWSESLTAGVEEARAEHTTAADDLSDLEAELDALEYDFEANPWPRAFQVPGGHLHASADCPSWDRGHTSTRYAWRTDLSGRTEAEIVGEFGADACTICYPSAPTPAPAPASAHCPGSGTTDYNPAAARTGYATGNGATCAHCGAWTGLTQYGRLRKHGG